MTAGDYQVWVRYGNARYRRHAELPYEEASDEVFRLRADPAVNWAYMDESPIAAAGAHLSVGCGHPEEKP